MKNHPLSIQIWSVFALITLVISIIISIILPVTLKSFFTKEIYATIDSAQDLILNQFDSNIYRDFIEPDFFGKQDATLENIRTVRHFIVYGDNIISNFPIPTNFISKITKEALEQKNQSQKYDGEILGEKVFYTITRDKVLNSEILLVSYMVDSYREDLVNTLYKKLFSIVFIVLLLSWLPAIFLSRYLTKPLVDLERQVEDLTKRIWDNPINLSRQDEIGKLGLSIEKLRKQLIKQDESEQAFLQNISHELKTPIMVIRSFAGAIKDGIYPKSNLNNSIEVIENEALRLENRVKDLLYLTKLDYVSNHPNKKTLIDLTSIIINTVDRISIFKPSIKWSIELEPITIYADHDQMRVLIENILNNQIKYSNDKIRIWSENKKNFYKIKIWNNGPKIEEEILDSIFSTFVKGKDGEFGLGLAIVNKIAILNNLKVYAMNTHDGVEFNIEIKKQTS